MNNQTEQVKPATRRNPMQVVAQLKARAQSDKAFEAVCHIFAIRERARSQVMLGTLRLTMSREGFNFSRKQYEECLKFLASLGIGKIYTDAKGQIQGLKDIGVTLQSIGLAAIGRKESFERLHINRTYSHIRPVTEPLQTTKTAEEPKLQAAVPAPKAFTLPTPKPREYQGALTLIIDNQPVDFNFPRKVTMEEVGKLFVQLFEKLGGIK